MGSQEPNSSAAHPPERGEPGSTQRPVEARRDGDGGGDPACWLDLIDDQRDHQ